LAEAGERQVILPVPKELGGDYVVPGQQQKETDNTDTVKDAPTVLPVPVELGGDYVVPGQQQNQTATPQAQHPQPVAPQDLTIVKAAQNVASALTPEQSSQQEDSGSWADIFTGADRETRGTEDLPELGSGGLLAGEDLGKVAKIAPILAMTYDPLEVSKIIQTNFPYIRQTEDEKGNIYLNNNKTGAQVVVNKPGFSYLDLIQGGATAAAFASPAKLATLPTKLGGKVALGAGGAGALETSLQTAQESQGGDFSGEDIALSIGLGGAGELVMPAIKSIKDWRTAKKLDIAKAETEGLKETIDTGREAAEKVGGRLFQGQQTMSPAQLEKQSFIPQLPSGTRRSTEQLKAQNEDAYNAVENLLKEIAPDESIVTGNTKFRTASQNAIEKVKNIRKEKASPIYKEALKEGADVDLKPVHDLIEEKLKDIPESGEISRTLKKVSKYITGKSQKDSAGDIITELKPSLKRLHYAKIEMDQMFDKFGDNALGNTTKRELTEVKNLLMKQIDNASPLYKEARAKFAELTPEVLKIQDSIVGKVANLSDDKLKTISKQIFDASETNPTVLRTAKRIIKDVDPNAWNELLRTELERRMGTLRIDPNEMTTGNLPGQLYSSIFGNKKNRDVLFNAVDGQTRKNLKYLETYLKRARLGRNTGSQTASRESIKDELKGGFWQGLRNLVSHPIDTMSGIGGDVMFNNKVRAMADSVFDPQWTPDMKALDSLSPREAESAFEKLMEKALKTGEEYGGGLMLKGSAQNVKPPNDQAK